MAAEPHAETVVNVHDAKTNLSKLLARVEAGEQITIARAGRPVARLVPARRPRPSSAFGAMRGAVAVRSELIGPDPDIDRMFGL